MTFLSEHISPEESPALLSSQSVDHSPSLKVGVLGPSLGRIPSGSSSERRGLLSFARDVHEAETRFNSIMEVYLGK